MALIRVLRTAAAALTHTFYVDETPTSASVDVEVTVKRLDGTVVAGPTAATPGDPGEYTYILPAQAELDSLTVDWVADSVGGAVVTATDYIEIVGGYLFGIAEARASDATLANLTTYPTAKLSEKRLEVEEECEEICRQAFVPRFARETLSGTGTDRIGLTHMILRRLRSVAVSGVAWSSPDVAAVPPADNGVARLPGGVWPRGVGNIVIEYEHGWDRPPERISAAAMLHLRYLCNQTRTGMPDRVTSYTNEAGTFIAATQDESRTGYPDIDSVYRRYTRLPRAVFA